MFVEKLVEELNDLKLVQTELFEEIEYQFPNKTFDKYFESKGYEIFETGQNIEKHRWYETDLCIMKFDTGEMIGFYGITQLYSENSDYIDCYYPLKFFPVETEEVMTTKYVRV